MSVRSQHPDIKGIYFITFTCHNWIPLFQLTEAWHLVYRQFDFLKDSGNDINGYVIMPNHIHALIHFFSNKKSEAEINMNGEGMISKAVGRFKRFLAYELIGVLEQQKRNDILSVLEAAVHPTDRSRGKKHQVFEPSFDCKLCTSEQMVWEKLNYIHNNPCRGKWQLAPYPAAYPHSSCKYYETGCQGIYEVVDFRNNR